MVVLRMHILLKAVLAQEYMAYALDSWEMWQTSQNRGTAPEIQQYHTGLGMVGRSDNYSVSHVQKMSRHHRVS